ncbi:hypothetical protein F9L33_04850 [Amylibacter sp. SFDW26]|uniref:hypothetical protein n=1 Tax=Amylibacter sp. SFDW26 TaxID=2652722 RepID=UPI0012620811|nr:hypothetical protein [Amylibacter sp. SFDW26]KAB7616094.1 hypothetical protein F9L33_04850 [Amylibacter sp. SFDW26]
MLKNINVFILIAATHLFTTDAQAETIQCNFKKECGYRSKCSNIDYNLNFVEHDEGDKYGLVDLDTASIEGHTKFAFRKSNTGTLLGVDTNSNFEPVRYYLLSFGRKAATMSIQGVDNDGIGWSQNYHGTCIIK